MNARIYDPDIARFLSPDPTIPYLQNLQSFNRYTYARNNPTTFIDPSGFSESGGEGDADGTGKGGSTGPEGTSAKGGDTGNNTNNASKGNATSATETANKNNTDQVVDKPGPALMPRKTNFLSLGQGSGVQEFGKGLIPGYDLGVACNNPEATWFDYGVGIAGVIPGIGKGAGLLAKGVIPC